MLKTAVLSSNPSTQSFLKLWIDRYQLDVVKLINDCTVVDLTDAIEAKGRKQTAASARKWIKTSSELAGLKTNSLFSYVPNVVSLEETKRIATLVEKIYAKLLDIYEQHQPSSDWVDLINTLKQSDSVIKNCQKTSIVTLPDIEQIANAVEPLIVQLQEKHLACQDLRAIGFMSTQFHFSTQILLSNLKPVEQIVLQPYLQFIEEQVCIPWQQICTAVNLHAVGSPILEAVKLMLPQSDEVAHDTLSRVMPAFSSYRSRRGLLTQPAVAASFTRDINMLQAYLWLCILESSMSSIKNELLPLCTMVFPAVSVDWELIKISIDVMANCICERLDRKYIPFVKVYIQDMQQLFIDAEKTFASPTSIASEQ